MPSSRQYHNPEPPSTPSLPLSPSPSPPLSLCSLAVGMTCVPGGVCLMAKDAVAYPVGRCLAMYRCVCVGGWGPWGGAPWGVAGGAVGGGLAGGGSHGVGRWAGCKTGLVRRRGQAGLGQM